MATDCEKHHSGLEGLWAVDLLFHLKQSKKLRMKQTLVLLTVVTIILISFNFSRF